VVISTIDQAPLAELYGLLRVLGNKPTKEGLLHVAFDATVSLRDGEGLRQRNGTPDGVKAVSRVSVSVGPRTREARGDGYDILRSATTKELTPEACVSELRSGGVESADHCRPTPSHANTLDIPYPRGRLGIVKTTGRKTLACEGLVLSPVDGQSPAVGYKCAKRDPISQDERFTRGFSWEEPLPVRYRYERHLLVRRATPWGDWPRHQKGQH
jgi:hypothetical protein